MSEIPNRYTVWVWEDGKWVLYLTGGDAEWAGGIVAQALREDPARPVLVRKEGEKP